MKGRTADYAAVVRANHAKTTGFLLASREPCIGIRDDEVRRIQRKLVRLGPDDLAGLQPPDSWVLGAILCPGDTTEDLAAWAKRTKAEAGRVWFFAHADIDLAAALAGWVEAGFRTNQVDVVQSWAELHPLFGLALNDQVFADFSA